MFSCLCHLCSGLHVMCIKFWLNVYSVIKLLSISSTFIEVDRCYRLNYVPLNFYVEVPTLSTSQCDYIWIWVFKAVINLK